jgi:Cu/Ag efflux protein CusF
MSQKPLSHKPVLIAAIAALLAAPVYAQVELDTQPVRAEATETSLEGEVMVVNANTRLMTLKTADGTYEVLHVPPEVKRLDEIKIGDKVSITETSTALIELQSGRDAGAMGAVGDVETLALPGDKPAGAVTENLTLYGKIVGIDKSAGTVTVQGAETTRVFPVQEPAMLDEAKVGDGVVVKYRRVVTGEVTVN